MMTSHPESPTDFAVQDNLADNTSTDQGHFERSGLIIDWYKTGSAPEIEIQVKLQFGQQSQIVYLDASNLQRSFSLQNSAEEKTVMRGDINLEIDRKESWLSVDAHQLSTNSERTVEIYSWQACSPNSPIKPISGKTDLGDGWNANWWVSGADDSCLQSSTILSFNSNKVGVADLSSSVSRWATNLPAPYSYLECSVTQNINGNGHISLTATLPETKDVNTDIHAILAHWKQKICPDVPPQDPGNHQYQLIGDLLGPSTRCTLTFPKLIRTPSRRELSTRFVNLFNNSTFQAALVNIRSGDNSRKNLLLEAQKFVHDAKPYAGQFVSDPTEMPSPFDQLSLDKTEVLLSRPTANSEQLDAQLSKLLGTAVSDFVNAADFSTEKKRLEDSLTALIILNSSQQKEQCSLINALLICHLSTLLAEHPQDIASALEIEFAKRASITLSLSIFPVPPANTSGSNSYAACLGISDVLYFEQKIVAYSLGNIAYIENVMRGQERSTSQEKRLETVLHDDLNQAHLSTTKELENRIANTHSSPALGISKTFDNIQQQYDTSGLNITLSGNTNELPGRYSGDDSNPFAYQTQAEHFVRNVSREALSQVNEDVQFNQHQIQNTLLTERNTYHFNNIGGAEHLIGIYRWINETCRNRLYKQGERLIIEFVLPNPGDFFVNGVNKLYNENFALPIAPENLSTPILSSSDISADNYQQLALTYNIQFPAPPPQTLTLGLSLQTYPGLETNQVQIPAGYGVQQVDLAYAFQTPANNGGDTLTPALFVVLGNQSATLSASSPGQQTVTFSAPVDGTMPLNLISNIPNTVVNAMVYCQLLDSASAYVKWQTATYKQLLEAYNTQKSSFLATLDAYVMRSQQQAGPLGFEQHQLMQQSIEFLLGILQPDPPVSQGWQQDQNNLQLIPFFYKAIEWAKMTISYYPDFFTKDATQRPQWLKLMEKEPIPSELSSFFQAGSARVIVPVNAEFTLSILYYLSSEGRFWQTPHQRTPVFENDIALVNDWKEYQLCPEEPADLASWEIESATPLMQLQADSNLPAFENPIVKPGSTNV